MATRFALFDTALGPCAIIWSSRGIVGIQIFERDEAKTLARVKRRFPDSVEADVPPAIRKAADDVVGLLAGEARDLSSAPIDLDGVPEFHRRVYEIARRIPPGETMSYGAIAAELGDPAAAREVGEAMGKNPMAIIVPCHRVVASNGKLGGFSASGGVATKRKLLAIESKHARPAGTLFA